MIGVVLTVIVGFSIIFAIRRFVRALLSRDVSQVFKMGSDDRPIHDPQDPLDPLNQGLSPGDVGYDDGFASN